jgi:adenine-specific DNA-methyltransferase
VALIKDIDLANPHRAHLDILTDLHIQSGEGANRALNNFDVLYQAWTKILSTEELNKRFYRHLSNWYIWAVGTKKHPHIGFPVAAEVAGDDGHKLNQISVIRLLTRLIFVWFIKEKGLVPNALFHSDSLKGLLQDDPADHPEDSTYYKAILQNLFFATLNTQMEGDGRKWRLDKSETGRTPDYLISSLFRYKDAFQAPDEALGMFRKVPFLNGGLFECLDREVADAELERTFAGSILPNVRHPHIQFRQEAMVANWTLGQFHQALMDEGKNETLEVPKRCVQNLCYFEKAVFSVTIGDHVHHDADAIC